MSGGDYRCYVGGLSLATGELDLQRAFSQFGQVISSQIITDRETGRSKGFGFVTFKDEKSMTDAIEGMNGKEFEGSTITVKEAHMRGGGGGGSRGGFSGYGGGNYGGGGSYGGRSMGN